MVLYVIAHTPTPPIHNSPLPTNVHVVNLAIINAYASSVYQALFFRLTPPPKSLGARLKWSMLLLFFETTFPFSCRPYKKVLESLSYSIQGKVSSHFLLYFCLLMSGHDLLRYLSGTVEPVHCFLTPGSEHSVSLLSDSPTLLLPISVYLHMEELVPKIEQTSIAPVVYYWLALY